METHAMCPTLEGLFGELQFKLWNVVEWDYILLNVIDLCMWVNFSPLLAKL